VVRRFQWICAGQLTVTATALKEKLSLNVMKLYRDDLNPDSRISKDGNLFLKFLFAKSREIIPSNFSISQFTENLNGSLTNIWIVRNMDFTFSKKLVVLEKKNLLLISKCLFSPNVVKSTFRISVCGNFLGYIFSFPS